MTTHFTATTTADFDNDITDIDGGPDSAPNTAYFIALSTGISVGNIALTLPSGSSLEIDGPGFLVVGSGDALTVTGALTLNAPVTGAVVLDGSMLTIDAVTDTGGIQGGGAFTGTIVGETVTDAVVTDGTVTTTAQIAIHLTGGTVTNQANGAISGGTYGVVFDGTGTLGNTGSVSGGTVGAYFSANGTLNNSAAGASVEGSENGVDIIGAATVTNSGTIEATTSDAVFAGSGTVTNGSATQTGAKIETQGSNAVEIDGAGTVGNDGQIVSSDVAGIYLGSGTVDNGLDSSAALIQGAEFGVLVATGSGTVVNDGKIMLAGTPSGMGSEIAVVLEDGGSVTNGATAATATGSALIAGSDYGISILGAAGTVDNTGTVTGSVATDLEAGGTVVNGFSAGVGSITGTTFGVRVIGSGDAASVTNAGSITGQVGVDFFDSSGSATGTLIDSGSIVSTAGATGTAVDFGDGAERLVLQTGFAITGIVQGGQGMGDVTTLELAGGTSGAFTGVTGGAGAITGKFNFLAVTAIDIDGGATWSFSGTEAVASLQVGGNAVIGGALDVTALTDAAGTLQIAANGRLELGAATGHGNTIAFGAGATLKIDTAAQFGSGQGSTASYSGDTISGFGLGKFIDLANVSYATATLQSFNAATGVAQITDGTHVADLTFAAGTSGLPGMLSLHADANGGTLVESAACYCAGTRIATPGGQTPVEELRIGDAVLTADGRQVPVRWIGWRRVDFRALPDCAPVRIAAHAFQPNQPGRDLFVSPEHAVYYQGVLVPAGRLAGCRGIATDDTIEATTYYHVELPEHAILLAEGLPCESWLDTGNRSMFENARTVAIRFNERRTADEAWAERSCAPLVTGGPALEALRRRLGAEPAATIAIGGPGEYRVTLAPGSTEIHLTSGAGFAPGDARALGAAISRISLDGDAIALTDGRLCRGFHPAEAGWRWTDGEGCIQLERSDAERVLIAEVSSVVAQPERRAGA